MSAQRIYRLLLITVLLSGTGCFEGAPRRHPLDPLGENYRDEGGISVQVTNFYAPHQGLEGAGILLQPGSFFAETDALGRVVFPDLSSGAYTVTSEKEGFAGQSQTVNVTTGETADVVFRLPGLPDFTEINVSTLHISRWWPPPEEIFRLNIDAVLEDPDGLSDIEEVWVEIPDFDFSAPLDPTFEPGRFSLILIESALPAAMPALLGHEIVLHARDRIPTENSSEVLTIFRIIDSSPLALVPQGLQLLETMAPRLTWEPVSFNYPFSYRVDVVRVDNNVQNLAWSASNIPSDSSSVVTSSLQAGEYFWTVSIVDEFGNRSRSREAGFRIP